MKKPKRKSLNKTERYHLLKKQNWRCASCGKRIKYSKKHKYGEEVAHVDHIHPISKYESYDGCINEMKNFQGLCETCNRLKSDKEPKHCPDCGKLLQIRVMGWSEGWANYFSEHIWNSIKDEEWVVYLCNGYSGCGTFWSEDEIKQKV